MGDRAPGQSGLMECPGAQGGMGIQMRERSCLVVAHQAAVADHVGGQDRRQTAFHLRPPLGPETIKLPCENLCGERTPEYRLLAEGVEEVL